MTPKELKKMLKTSNEKLRMELAKNIDLKNFANVALFLNDKSKAVRTTIIDRYKTFKG